MSVKASAPSNIALIKYMGKSSVDGNLPANASLSYTLENLRTFVEITEVTEIADQDGDDQWRPLPGLAELPLSEMGRKKFLNHFQRLKAAWKVPGRYVVRSANNFPSDCGLASSASSFAALTRAAYQLAKSHHPQLELSEAELARHSRSGSGSSCRSFFAPWSLWSGVEAGPAPLSVRLEHAAVLVEDARKSVSSSEAHRRVATSLLYPGRAERAQSRLEALLVALDGGGCGSGARAGWREAMELVWSEFWDMHALFETSSPAFGYMNAGTLAVLSRLRSLWQETGDGPLVTMDAGPNVHLLLRPEQTGAAAKWLEGFKVMCSWTAEAGGKQ